MLSHHTDGRVYVTVAAFRTEWRGSTDVWSCCTAARVTRRKRCRGELGINVEWSRTSVYSNDGLAIDGAWRVTMQINSSKSRDPKLG
jgi:hypothetical protein